MREETQEIENKDGTCGMQGCEVTATGMAYAKVPEPFAVGDVTMEIKVHLCEACRSKIVEEGATGKVFSMSNFDQQTADYTSAVKEKTEECKPYVPKPFTVENLMSLSGDAHYFVDEDPTDMFLVRAYKRFAEGAVDLATRLGYSASLDERCALRGCENPAYAPVEPTMKHRDLDLGLKVVRICKACIKDYGLTIKDGVAYGEPTPIEQSQ